MSAQIIKFPRKLVRQPKANVRLHQMLDQAIACARQGDHTGADQAIFNLAGRMGMAHLVEGFADLYGRVAR
jgi:hypothetical protein